ncbi:response regulator transcription factor [Vibrio sp. S17_S38]|uniref:response regulator transcription factor n=1 Tax=Vibrio sp. S17_S38 TaxID=2720229 RepID=UPI0016802B2D|nr:response regulator transcription factor [Vibrio sp. S17_S38]MBD1573316.1 response regulator transcription factor [Vibrio sp. S17_S38]
MKLLIIEDSEALRRSIMVGLNNLGFTVDEAGDGATGLSMALLNPYDLIILDLMLPNVDGMDILKSLRKQNIETKVIILSAKNLTKDKIDGLMQGADDYLTKPFSFEELHARILALLRRGQTNQVSNSHHIAGFTLDLETKNFSYLNQDIDLTRNEFKIIECLFLAQGRVVNVEMISEAVMGNFDHLSKNTIESHLSSVRKKARECGGDLPIKNKRGFGYIIEKSAS